MLSEALIGEIIKKKLEILLRISKVVSVTLSQVLQHKNSNGRKKIGKLSIVPRK